MVYYYSLTLNLKNIITGFALKNFTNLYITRIWDYIIFIIFKVQKLNINIIKKLNRWGLQMVYSKRYKKNFRNINIKHRKLLHSLNIFFLKIIYFYILEFFDINYVYVFKIIQFYVNQNLVHRGFLFSSFKSNFMKLKLSQLLYQTKFEYFIL